MRHQSRSLRSNQEGNAHSLYAISSIPITAVANQKGKNQFPRLKRVKDGHFFGATITASGRRSTPAIPACFHRASPARYKRKPPSASLPRDSSAAIRVAPRDSSVRKGIAIQLAPRDSTTDRQLLSTRGCHRPHPPPHHIRAKHVLLVELLRDYINNCRIDSKTCIVKHKLVMIIFP